MLKILKKNFSYILLKLENKTNKYIEIKIDNKENSKYRLANFIRNKYNLKWDIIQKSIRKKDIFIVRDNQIILKSDEKLKFDDKIFICKFTLNIFEKNNQEKNQIINKNEKISNVYKKNESYDDFNHDLKNKEQILSSKDPIPKINKFNSNNQIHDNIYPPELSINFEEKNFVSKNSNNFSNFIEDNFDQIENLNEEKKFLIDLFKGMVLYASNLYFIIDKKYNIASQRGTYLKFSIDDCLKILNEINRNNNLKLVHRLDRNVSGLMILGNDLDFVRKISEDMKESKISKTYVCICQNVPRYFKELVNENRINLSRPDHLKESLEGNVFSNEFCDNFSILTKSGYLFERNNEIIYKSKEHFIQNNAETKTTESEGFKEFNLKKLNNFTYNKLFSDKISKIRQEKRFQDIKNNYYEMQGVFRITHLIFKDIGEGKGNNFVAFEIDKAQHYDEETIEKFNKFLERLKINLKSKNILPKSNSNNKENCKTDDLINNNDQNMSLKDLMKKQIKISKKNKENSKQQNYSLSNDDEFYTIVTYELISGKKHQIRKHMSKTFFTPIFNDEVYFFNSNNSYIAYKNFFEEIEKQKKEIFQNKLKLDLNNKEFEINHQDNKGEFKKQIFLNNIAQKDLYERYEIDDLSKGILLNSFQIKININDNELETEKINFCDKNKLLVFKKNNEKIFQKKFLSYNFRILLNTMGLSHINEYFSTVNKLI